MRRRTLTGCALLLAACGATHGADLDAGRDAGLDAAVELDCPTLLALEEGAACHPEGLVCLGPYGVLCPQRESRCVDGRVRHGETWARDVWVHDGGAPVCPESESTVTHLHETPRGEPLEVVASLESGFTTSLALIFVPPPFEACRHPRLMVRFFPLEVDSYEGTFPIEAPLALEDGEVPLSGEVVIHAHDRDEGRFAGTISMTGGGHTVEGELTVTACPDLHRPSI